MQIGRPVLVDLDAFGHQLVVQHAGRQAGQPVVHLALQQQAHPHAAPCRLDQRPAKALAGIEIRGHQIHPPLRPANGSDQAALDRTALPQVVPHDEGRPHRLQRIQPRVQLPLDAQRGGQAAHGPQRLGTAQQGQHLLAPTLPQAGAGPHRAQRLCHRGHHRAAQADGKVQPRRGVQAVVDVEPVVDEVDAADEGLRAIHHAELLVEAAQLPGLQPVPPARERAEDHQLHAGRLQPLPHPGQAAQRAEAVHHHPHRQAAPRSRGQGQGHPLAGRVVMEDVGGQPDLLTRLADRRDQGGKELIAPSQQRDLVAALEGRPGRTLAGSLHRPRHASASSTTSGRWSDMRAQAAPRGTLLPRQRKPRM